MKLRNKIPYMLLTAIAIIMIVIITPKGCYFGSKIDWIDQHVVISDIFRKNFYHSGNLFSTFIPGIGAGSSIYAFSYYGLFRPDVLLSFFIPQVSMTTIITGYSIFLMISSIDLCYYWLSKKGIDKNICFVASCLLMFSSLLFQTHRQLMFVNYMPFLFLSLIGTERYVSDKRINLLIFALFMVIIHSFYFSISCIVVIYIYYFYLEHFDLKKLIRFTSIIAIPIMLSAILIIPSGMYLIANKRTTTITTPFYALFGINYQMENILYYQYGMGLSAISFILLISGLKNKRMKRLAIPVIICLAFNIITFALNGGLYIRDKVYIPFLPLVILIVAEVMQDISRKKSSLSWWSLLIIVPLVTTRFNIIHVIDILTAFMIICWLSNNIKLFSRISLILPIAVCLNTNSIETYAKIKQYPFTEKELNRYIKNDGRYQDLIAPMISSNKLTGNRTSIYSSMVNSQYNTFYYDVADNAIRIRNRVAVLDSKNLVFYQIMGVKYLTCGYKNIPYGYHSLYQKGKYVIAENKNVRPLAYVAYSTFDNKSMKEKNFPEKLEILNERVVVDSDSSKMNTELKELTVSKNECSVNNKHQKVSYYDTGLKNKLVFVEFRVISNKETTIKINGIKNRLSAANANYPNGNKVFRYVLAVKDNPKLKITLSKGKYRLKNLKISYMDINSLDDIKYDTASHISQKDHPLECNINATDNGYFVTSIPYQHGFNAYIDDKEVNIEKVNTAFVGFKIPKGRHKIKITYEAPGLKAGIAFTMAGMISWIIVARRKRNEKIKRVD